MPEVVKKKKPWKVYEERCFYVSAQRKDRHVQYLAMDLKLNAVCRSMQGKDNTFFFIFQDPEHCFRPAISHVFVDLLECRTRNTTRVEQNNMGLFVNRHYESTWFEVKDHGNQKHTSCVLQYTINQQYSRGVIPIEFLNSTTEFIMHNGIKKCPAKYISYITT